MFYSKYISWMNWRGTHQTHWLHLKTKPNIKLEEKKRKDTTIDEHEW